MRKLMIGLAAGCVLAICLGAAFETKQLDYSPLRSAVTADDTALDGTTDNYTFAWADKPAAAIAVHPYYNNAQIIFSGTDAADESCNFKVYVWRVGGPATLVCTGSFTLGTAKTGATNTYFADTIEITDVWPTDIRVGDSGNNRVATLSFDLLGHSFIFCEIDIPASGQVASASASISGF